MILILRSQFDKSDDNVIEALQQDAEKVLQGAGVEYETQEVPGAVELPIAAQQLARKLKPEAIIALGCVIQGDTDHYDMVIRSCGEGLTRVALDEGIPIIQGVLACKDKAQATARKHLGAEFAQTALYMTNLLSK